MRIRMAFLCCTVVAMAALLAPTAALATGYWSCSSTFLSTANVTILAGPCPISKADVDAGIPSTTQCAAAPDPLFPYTAIKYQVTGGPDHAATVVTANNDVVPQSGFQVYGAGVGDSVTGLGKRSLHEKAIKVNPSPYATGEFWVVVEGTKSAVPQSVVLKKGSSSSCVKAFAIDGLGFDEPVAPIVEIQRHGDCAVAFTLNGLTGGVISAKLTPDSHEDCSSPSIGTDGVTIKPLDVGVLGLTLDLGGDPIPLGVTNFGNGIFNSGLTSCTTKVVGGKVYTYGRPCP